MTLTITIRVVLLTSSAEGKVVLSNSARVFLTNSPTLSLCFTCPWATASDTFLCSLNIYMAGVAGLEPAPKVLETSMLTIDNIHLSQRKTESGKSKVIDFPLSVFPLSVYLLSLCTRWQRQRRQNFLNSSLFGVFFLFFVVT